MSNLSLQSGSLQLEPIESPRDGAYAADAGDHAARPAAVSRESEAAFIVTATSEFDSGWIDRPLWESVLAQSKGDAALAKTAYLRTRATVLQIERRDHDAQAPSGRSPRRSHAASAPQVRHAGAGSSTRSPAAGSILTRRNLLLAAPLVVVLLALGVWLMARGTDVDTGNGASGNPTQASATARARPVIAPATDNAAATVSETEGLRTRIDKLSAVGNWNVVVLLASEWTRREPGNVDAWIVLSGGYARMHQFGDAVEAAQKAAQIAPGNPVAWRNLGKLQIEAGRSEDATRTFERAVVLDGHDLASLLQVGMLNAQSSHLPEATAAFERVLAAAPGDVAARCGLAFVARLQGQAKDAEAIEARLKADNQTCRDWSLGTSADKVAVRPSYVEVPVQKR